MISYQLVSNNLSYRHITILAHQIIGPTDLALTGAEQVSAITSPLYGISALAPRGNGKTGGMVFCRRLPRPVQRLVGRNLGNQPDSK